MPVATLTFIVVVVYVGLFALHRRFYERGFLRTVMYIRRAWVVNKLGDEPPPSYFYVQKPVFKSAATFSV